MKGAHVEDNLALKRGGGIVEMENDVFRALYGLKGFFD